MTESTGSQIWDNWFAMANLGKRVQLAPSPRKKRSERLQERLRQLGYEVELPVRSYKAGYAEAWAWKARIAGSQIEIGSEFSMTECLRFSDKELEQALE